MADFSRTRFEEFRDRCEAAVEKTFVSLGLTAEALDAIEGRLTGRLTIEAGNSRLEIPVDVRADLFDVDGDEGPQDGEGTSPFEVTAEVLDDGLDYHRLEALRHAVAAKDPAGEDPDVTVRRARAFVRFLNEDDGNQPTQPAPTPF